MSDNDPKMTALFKEFYKLDTDEQRQAFWNAKPTGSAITNAQRMYSLIYNDAYRREAEEGVFDPFGQDINSYFSPKIAAQFRGVLARQCSQKQQEMPKPDLVYHVSSTAPSALENGQFIPRLQQEHFRDKKVSAVFATSEPYYAFCFQCSSPFRIYNNRDGVQEILIADLQKFMAEKTRNPYSYVYAFAADTFSWNVGYNGEVSTELMSLDTVAPAKCEQLDVETAYQICKKKFKTFNVFFCASPQDYNQIKHALKDGTASAEDLMKSGKLVSYEAIRSRLHRPSQNKADDVHHGASDRGI